MSQKTKIGIEVSEITFHDTTNQLLGRVTTADRMLSNRDTVKQLQH